MSHYDFLGVGGLAYDLILQVERLPLHDDKYPAALIGKRPGGFIANATCAAAHLDLKTAYIGWVGDDSEGTLLHDDFLKWRVDPVGLTQVPGEVTPFTVVITDHHASRSILLPDSPLYHMTLSRDQLDLVPDAQIVYTYPRDPLWCSQLGARQTLALDVETAVPMSGPDLYRVIMQYTRVVFINESGLARIGVTSLADLVDGDRWVIMTAGSRGAYGIHAGLDEPLFVPAYPVQAVDTTGAGDCFHAALIAARLDGATLAEALRFANAAASIKVQHPGARGGLPTRAEIREIL